MSTSTGSHFYNIQEVNEYLSQNGLSVLREKVDRNE